MVAALAVFALSCGGASTRDVETAKSSRYDGDFETLFAAIRDYTLSTYSHGCGTSLQPCNAQIDADPKSGAIHTAWIRINIDTAPPEQEPERTRGHSMQANAADPRTPMNRYFIRFDVAVIGPRPYRVVVVGHAAKWARGDALMAELKGGDEPSWLAPRTDALVPAIHDRIKQYAVSSNATTNAAIDAAVSSG
jgi:hypothetical protein